MWLHPYKTLPQCSYLSFSLPISLLTSHRTTRSSHPTCEPPWKRCWSLWTNTAEDSTHTHTHTRIPGNPQLHFIYSILLLVSLQKISTANRGCGWNFLPIPQCTHTCAHTLSHTHLHTHVHTDMKALLLLTSDLVPEHFPAWILNTRPLRPDLNDPPQIPCKIIHHIVI